MLWLSLSVHKLNTTWTHRHGQLVSISSSTDAFTQSESGELSYKNMPFSQPGIKLRIYALRSYSHHRSNPKKTIKVSIALWFSNTVLFKTN